MLPLAYFDETMVNLSSRHFENNSKIVAHKLNCMTLLTNCLTCLFSGVCQSIFVRIMTLSLLIELYGVYRGSLALCVRYYIII